MIAIGRAPWIRTDEIASDSTAIEEAAGLGRRHAAGRRRFTELSGGEKARLLFERVLAQGTPVVFLDEPTAALDLRHQEDVLRIARSLADSGRTLVIVMHDLSLAGALADRVALMSTGALVAVGAPSPVLTVASVSGVYGLPVRVVEIDGRPLIVPER